MDAVELSWCKLILAKSSVDLDCPTQWTRFTEAKELDLFSLFPKFLAVGPNICSMGANVTHVLGENMANIGQLASDLAGWASEILHQLHDRNPIQILWFYYSVW